MKNYLFLVLALTFSNNVMAQSCAIGSASKAKNVDRAVTIEECTALAVNDVTLNKNPTKIEYAFEMLKGNAPKPYAYHIEMIVENPKAEQSHQGALNSLEKH